MNCDWGCRWAWCSLRNSVTARVVIVILAMSSNAFSLPEARPAPEVERRAESTEAQREAMAVRRKRDSLKTDRSSCPKDDTGLVAAEKPIPREDFGLRVKEAKDLFRQPGEDTRFHPIDTRNFVFDKDGKLIVEDWRVELFPNQDGKRDDRDDLFREGPVTVEKHEEELHGHHPSHSQMTTKPLRGATNRNCTVGIHAENCEHIANNAFMTRPATSNERDWSKVIFGIAAAAIVFRWICRRSG